MLLIRNITIVVATVVLRKPHRAAAKDGPVGRLLSRAVAAREVFIGADLGGGESSAASEMRVYRTGPGGRARPHSVNRSG